MKASTPPPALPQMDAAGGAVLDWEPVARGWIGYGVATTAQLELATLNQKNGLAIISKCEAREEKIRDALKPKRWKLF